MSMQTPVCGLNLLNALYEKSLPGEAFWRCFPFRLSRASLLESGAKVKKEAENSSIHACVTLSDTGCEVLIEKSSP
jgi:hypothetical protein